MLIGNNNNFNNDNNNFNNKFRAIKENNDVFRNPTQPTSNTPTNRYTDISNKNEVVDKTFQILKDRLDNGLITLDEFNKKCSQINKSRN